MCAHSRAVGGQTLPSPTGGPAWPRRGAVSRDCALRHLELVRRRTDEFGCPLSWPLDVAEARHHRGGITRSSLLNRQLIVRMSVPSRRRGRMAVDPNTKARRGSGFLHCSLRSRISADHDVAEADHQAYEHGCARTEPVGDLSGAQTRMGPLSCRFTGRVLGMVAPLPRRLGGHPGALKARLPHAVPLDPAARTPGPRRCRQGPGTPGAAPPAQRPAPPGPTAQVRARRPGPAGCDQPRAAPIALALLPCQAGDAAALASSPGRWRVDLSSRTRATAAG
jgi:hypothetical protein